MANEKILEVHYPAITSWQWHATLFSILGDDDNAKRWIYSNYIQLRCYGINEIFTGNDMLFADIMPGSSSLQHCPYLITSLMTKQQIESYTSGVIDFIIKTIDLDGYVYGVFDEAKILCDVNVDYKFPHELFIYGYNIDKEIFYVGDFTFTDHYSYSTVSFADVERGYSVITASDDHMFKDDYKGTRGLYVILKNTNTRYYDLDINFIRDTLGEYLECKDTKNHLRMYRNRFNDTTFGVNVYDRLIETIEKQLSGDEPDYDIRALHIMYDHKVLMYERLKYLMGNDYLPMDQALLDEYLKVVDRCLTARNLLVRISITDEIDRVDRFGKYLNEAKEIEIKVLTKVRELLGSYEGQEFR
ncbi:MAG: hypothetical protein IKQ71_03905 [Lachnospiraceae bacterium]|nr:hypothetical protein [Lachnospiraceae bacterium]